MISEVVGGALIPKTHGSVSGVLILTLAVGLTACSSDETYLPALLEDPMAHYEAEGIELTHSWEQAESPGFLGGKPTQARVERTYRIQVEREAEALLDKAVSYAESQGWRMQVDMTVPTLFTGAKLLPSGGARLSIALGPTDRSVDPDGTRVLNIHLDFGSVRFEDSSTSASWL